ncbi:hypothetical protein MRB53_010052 [Persea americana]|uniref:Uncharacterized protein n=1 Tax=Persea americana TaxID=3435 RepID=A0ACC2LQY5_PERAE|nr:hypothetical protein MRB53_010052 [Persea americana]
MNDFESEASNIALEEEKLKTEVKAIEEDIESAKSETKGLKEEMDRMLKLKGNTCCQIVNKQKKITMLETESSTLSKTLELLQQEKVSSVTKIKEKRVYYAKVMEDMSIKLQEQQDWFNSYKLIKEADEGTLGHTAKNCSKMHLANMDIHQTGCYTNEKYKDLETQLESAKAKHEEITAKKSKLALENSKIKQNIKQLKSRFDDFPAELKVMDINALEEEQKALLSDKAGEMEYLQSLQERTEQIKVISEVVKCRCGREYVVEMSQ